MKLVFLFIQFSYTIVSEVSNMNSLGFEFIQAYPYYYPLPTLGELGPYQKGGLILYFFTFKPI